MIILLILTIAVLLIVWWLSSMFERLYKFRQTKFFELLNLAKSNNTDELIDELDDIYNEMVKKELKINKKEDK
jgi:DNA-binding FadR family transcriptional regulator